MFQAKGTACAKALGAKETGLVQGASNPTCHVPVSSCFTPTLSATTWHRLAVLCT